MLKNSKVVHDKLFCKANDAENPAKRSAQIPAVDVFLAVSPSNQKLHSSLALQGWCWDKDTAFKPRYVPAIPGRA